MVRGVQLPIGYHYGTIATGDWLVVATRGFHRILRFSRFGHDFKFAESSKDVSPSQRYQDFLHGSRQAGHSSRRETWIVWSGLEDQDYCEWIARNSFFDPVEIVHEDLGGQDWQRGVRRSPCAQVLCYQSVPFAQILPCRPLSQQTFIFYVMSAPRSVRFRQPVSLPHCQSIARHQSSMITRSMSQVPLQKPRVYVSSLATSRLSSDNIDRLK
jgi:hypothetical protein